MVNKPVKIYSKLLDDTFYIADNDFFLEKQTQKGTYYTRRELKAILGITEKEKKIIHQIKSWYNCEFKRDNTKPTKLEHQPQSP